MDQFLTSEDFSNFDWPNNFSNSSFEINIKTDINSGSLLTQT